METFYITYDIPNSTTVSTTFEHYLGKGKNTPVHNDKGKKTL